MNRSVVNAVSVIGKMGGAERHFPDDKKMGKAVTGLESESVEAHEVSNNNTRYVFNEDGGGEHRWVRYLGADEEQ